jgi:hypothetical protein
MWKTIHRTARKKEMVMDSVPVFKAYVLSRPNGWHPGVYEGTFSDEGLRLYYQDVEVLHVTPGTPGVVVDGATMSFPVQGGMLVVQLRPPYPANPAATALAFALYLAGNKQQHTEAEQALESTLVGLTLLACFLGFVAFVFMMVVAVVVGFWFSIPYKLVLLGCFWSLRQSKTPADRTTILSLFCVVSSGVIFLSVVILVWAYLGQK